MEEWLDRFVETEVASVAVVYPEDQLGKHAVDQVGRAYDPPTVESVFVDDRQVAVNWLRGK